MDFSYGAWFPELDMEDARELMNQFQQTRPYCELMDSFSSQSFQGYHSLVRRDQSINATTIRGEIDSQAESYKGTMASSFAPVGGGSTPSTFTISFGDFNATNAVNQNQPFGGYKRAEMNLNELLGSIEFPKRVSGTRRNHRQAQEHILAERKRREKLTQRFISLSTLLPEIKKMDKATVLEDASKYIKHLQNRVKELEETSISGKTIIHELSTTSMTKSKFNSSQELYASSFDDPNSLPGNAACNPGIKVRILGSNVLVRIYCQINPPLALKALNEMERLCFTIICNSVVPISSTAALITIIGQVCESIYSK